MGGEKGEGPDVAAPRPSRTRTTPIRTHEPLLSCAAPLALLATLCVAPPLAASGVPPVVQAQLKINPGSGGFTGPLGADDVFGSSVAVIGDVNGDGNPDLAVGAPDASSPPGGAVWILFRAADGTISSQVRIDATTAGLPLDADDDFGRAIAPLGDLDGNGQLEIAVGAPNCGPGSLFGAGAVFVLSLTSSGTVAAWSKLAEGVGPVPLPATFTGFGSALATVPDLDGDGLPELAVTDSLGVTSEPVIWLLHMASDGSASSAVSLLGSDPVYGGAVASGDHFGQALAAVPDLDGDGHAELAIGAPGTGSTHKGAVWVTYLQPGPTFSAAVEIAEGAAGFAGLLEDGAQFGGALAAGDMDGDGQSELVVGTPFGDNAGGTTSGSGAAWVLGLDSAAQVTVATRVAEAEDGFIGPLGSDDQFGCALALLPRVGAADTLVAGARGDGGSFVFAPGASWELTFAFAANPWTSLGSALAGTNGAPVLAGSGPLTSGSAGALSLSNALPGGSSNLVIGISQINLPLKGGVLVPSVNLLIAGLPINGSGSLVLPFTWPTGIPSGIAFYFQHWFHDAGGPKGFAASNALKGTTP